MNVNDEIQKFAVRVKIPIFTLPVPKTLIMLCPAGRDTTIYGMDLSSRMLQIAQNKMRQAGFSKSELRKAGCRDLLYGTDTFDVLYNGYMLDLIPLAELSIVMAELKRVLKPGGRLILLNMSKRDEKITLVEELYMRLPAKFVMYFIGMCRPVLMEGLVKETGFQHVDRTFWEGVVASEIVTAYKIKR